MQPGKNPFGNNQNQNHQHNRNASAPQSQPTTQTSYMLDQRLLQDDDVLNQLQRQINQARAINDARRLSALVEQVRAGDSARLVPLSLTLSSLSPWPCIAGSSFWRWWLITDNKSKFTPFTVSFSAPEICTMI
jgi:hypothetical protein